MVTSLSIVVATFHTPRDLIRHKIVHDALDSLHQYQILHLEILYKSVKIGTNMLAINTKVAKRIKMIFISSFSCMIADLHDCRIFVNCIEIIKLWV